MARHLSSEMKEVILLKALNRDGESLHSIAEKNHVALSTLGRWLSERRNEPTMQSKTLTSLSREQQFDILIETAALDEQALGAYCRQRGFYSFQLKQWKEEFVSSKEKQSKAKSSAELKLLQAENKSLKKDLRRKEKALAETSALLILKKKAHLIWGENEED